MANILVLGGGFGGVIAAESLAKKLGSDHQITLVSRTRKFRFYPALVRLAFGQCEPDDIEFDVREAMGDRSIRFVAGDVARIFPAERYVKIAQGDVIGDMPYDFLVLALGRRLKTELITGFFENAHHLLGVRAAKKFGEAAQGFHKGRAVIGYCDGARLPVPVFETAFALSTDLKSRDERDKCTITVVSSESTDQMFGGIPLSEALGETLKSHEIELINDFSISRLTPEALIADDGRTLEYDLNMIIPPFGGPAALLGTDMVDSEGYVVVDKTMRVRGVEGVYAVGDCVAFEGPKMGHMAVRQAEVAAENLIAELEGKELPATYDHELMLVLDAGGNESFFIHKNLWNDDPAGIQHSRFWGWAKRKQQQYWKARHA